MIDCVFIPNEMSITIDSLSFSLIAPHGKGCGLWGGEAIKSDSPNKQNTSSSSDAVGAVEVSCFDVELSCGMR